MKLLVTILGVVFCACLPGTLYCQGNPDPSRQRTEHSSPAPDNASKPPTASDTGALPKLSPEEQYQLLKLRALQDIEDEVVKWAQTRFWILAVLSILVGFFGVRALVREMLAAELRDAMRASADAQAAASQGRDAIKDVRAEATKYKELVEALTTRAKDVDEKLQEFKSRIEAEGTRASAAADLKVAGLDQQLTEIRHMVSKLATESLTSQNSLREYEKTLGEVRQLAVANQAEFADNSEFRIIVVAHRPGSKSDKLASLIIDTLSRKGFKASGGLWTESTPEHDEISIDYLARAERKAVTVQNIIEGLVAKEHYPVREIKLNRFHQFPEKEDYDIRVFL